jgi:hypothetical protein
VCVRPNDPRGLYPQRFRQPTTVSKYSRETDRQVWLNNYRLACQLSGTTEDPMIIRNLPLHLTLREKLALVTGMDRLW